MIGLLIKRISVCNELALRAILQEYGITGSQCPILLFVLKNYNQKCYVSQKDIENEFDLSNPSVSGILKRLEQKDLIERISCNHDARINYVLPTSKSLAIHEELAKGFMQNEEKITKDFSEVEKKQLEDYLERILKAMEGGI